MDADASIDEYDDDDDDDDDDAIVPAPEGGCDLCCNDGTHSTSRHTGHWCSASFDDNFDDDARNGPSMQMPSIPIKRFTRYAEHVSSMSRVVYGRPCRSDTNVDADSDASITNRT
jgi:hypothetical protein